MNFLPKASGTRPRVACEIMPQGVVAARSMEAGAPLSAVARVKLAEGAVAPSLKSGNIVDRVAVTAAIRQALEQIGERHNTRDGNLTLVIPDSAVRVLLLDFEALPSRLSEALPLVRFRLKKLLPFDADEAMVTYQVMSSSKSVVRVLAVAIPRDVLSEYETAAREAGFEPGAVLPSTLACLAAIDDAEPMLMVNANPIGVTVAIARGGILLLHRSVDLQEHPVGVPANLPPALFDTPSAALPSMVLPVVSADDTAGEWSAQEALPEHGRNPYADRVEGEAAVQGAASITALAVPPVSLSDSRVSGARREEPSFSNQQAPLLGEEIAQAVSVAVAYFEDTLAVAPERILSAGPLGAVELNRILTEHGLAQADGLKVRELVDSEALLSSAVTASVPRGWLSGVLGALHG